MGQKLAIHRICEEGRDQLQGTLEFNGPLNKISYYQIGGPATVVFTPKSMSDLAWISKRIAEARVPYFVLGWGSNILFPDEGYYGVVIRMKFLGTQMILSADGTELELGASVGCSTLLRKACTEGWGGLAHLTGIPGSVGGMVAMNAGTHLGEFKDCAVRVETVRIGEGPELTPVVRDLRPEDFSYRRNHFLKPGDLITRAWVRIRREEPAAVRAQIDDLYQRRKATQPVDLPSCGSVFMNPREAGVNAWQVVDQLGLRGHRIGHAQISEKHSNFIVNLGGAQASDVRALIELAKRRAHEELGIELHEEVKIL
jgi:UDP-N-acetylmuramate dehydrogenase